MNEIKEHDLEQIKGGADWKIALRYIDIHLQELPEDMQIEFDKIARTKDYMQLRIWVYTNMEAYPVLRNAYCEATKG